MSDIRVAKFSQVDETADNTAHFQEARAIMDASPVLTEIVRCASAVSTGDFGVWKERSELVLARYGALPIEQIIDDVLSVFSSAWAFAGVNADAAWLRVIEELIPLYASLCLWGQGMRPHFSLASDFFEAIAVTDFGDPSDEPLFMPFDAFTISFPPSLALGGASRIFVSRIPHLSIDAASFKWESYRATLLTPEPVYTQWKVGLSRKELFAEMTQKVDYVGAHISEKEFSYVPRVRTLVSNVLSYIEASGDLPTQVRGKKEAPQAVERIHPTRPLFEVGRVVKLDGNIRNALRESAGDTTKWSLAQRFIVRGHWRNQAHGPARSLRRRQWIEPHWKGPENVVAAFDRTYSVE